MCSYNKLGGTYACQNDHLLRDIPAEWGFKGYILADYNANHDTAASLKSGLDFEPWPGFVYGAVRVNAALLTGQASMADVDRHVLRMLRTWFAFGVFDRDAFPDDTASIPQASHRARADEQRDRLLLTPWRSKVAGLLEAWYPGQEGGTAIARVLFGDVDPGGRLPATFPRAEADLPTAGDPMKYPGVNDEEQYKEGVFVGYRWFDARKLKVAFPFGFGLSYTKWRLAEPRLHGRTVTVRVRNAGRRRGSTVVQLYVGLPASAAVPQPPRQLRGYRKVVLRPHRGKRIRFRLTDRDLAYWDTAAHGWRIARGKYRVMVGFSSRHVRRVGTIRQRHAKAAR